MWILSGVPGFSHNFELYTSKQKHTHSQSESNLGATSNVVVRMSREIPNNHHTLYCDNYFSVGGQFSQKKGQFHSNRTDQL